MTISLAIDHLVYAVPDLAAAVADIEERTGVAPVPGGAHVGRGTYNALLRADTTTACTAAPGTPAVCRRSTSGRPKAAVLPLPVLAWAIRS